MESDSDRMATRASRVGAWVGVGCVALSALVLAVMVRPSVSLVLAVLAMAVPQCICANRVGLRIGPKIASGPALASVPLGALAGLVVLLCTALTASGVGLCWGIFDGIRGNDWAYSYVGKPFVAVLFYGFWIATPLGVLAGLLIRVVSIGRLLST